MKNGSAKIERVIITSCLSTSGAFRLILAEHILNGTFCYDVISLNVETGESTSRHYNSTKVSHEANRAEALRVYDHYRELITAPAKSEEQDEPKRQTRLILPN